MRTVTPARRRWVAALALAAACGGGDAGGPTPPPPPPAPPAPVASVELSPATATMAVGATQQFQATVRDAQGNVLAGRSVAWSASPITAATITTGGLMTAVAPGPATVTAAVEGRIGTASVTVTPQLPTPSCRDCLEVVPGNLLLTSVGAQQQLAAYLVDGAGVRTPVNATFTSTRAGTVAVTTGGLVTAVALGSAQLTAQAGGRTSAPLLALVAAPVAGTMLVPDDQVERAPVPVNAQAELGVGYRYTIRIRGTPPVVGQMLSGTGSLPILGRVERVTPAGAELTEVELEVRPLKEVFPNLSLNESWDLDVPPTAGGPGRAPVDGPPGNLIQRPLKEGEFLVGPFTCKVDAGVTLTIPLALQVEALEVIPDLRAELTVSGGELRGLAVRGELRPRLILTPRVQVAVSASLTCKVILYELPVRVPGPLALVLKPEVPVGLGFQFGGSLPAQTGARIGIQGSASIAVAWACNNGVCVDVTNNTATLDGIFEPLVGGPATGQVDLSGSGFAFAALELTNPIVEQLGGVKIKMLEGQAGLRQRITVASTSVQATSPSYASSADLTLFTKVASEATASLAGLWQLQLWSRSSSDSLLLASTPRGSLQVTPTSVAAGTTAQPGDTAVFRVNLTSTTWLTLEAVEGVEIFWSTPQGLVSVCGFMEPEQPMQSQYECRLTFLEAHAGSQHFYAFVTAKIYGLPFATPFEIAPDSKATVLVGTPTYDIWHSTALYFEPDDEPSCQRSHDVRAGLAVALSDQGACTLADGLAVAGRVALTGSPTLMALEGQMSRQASPTGSGLAIAQAFSIVTDRIVIDAPGLTGTQGVIRFRLEITGSLATTGPCTPILDEIESRWVVRTQIMQQPKLGGPEQRAFDFVRGVAGPCPNQPGGPALPATLVSTDVVFTYGTPFYLYHSLQAYAGTIKQSPGVTAASATVLVTYRWLGIEGLPPAATFFSATGIDWRLPHQP